MLGTVIGHQGSQSIGGEGKTSKPKRTIRTNSTVIAEDTLRKQKSTFSPVIKWECWGR